MKTPLTLILIFMMYTRHLNLALVLGGAATVYFAALFCIKGISRDDLKDIAGVLVFERSR